MEFYHLDFTLHIKYWIFGFDSRRKFSTGGGCNSSPHYKRSESISDASGGICSRCAGRYLYRAYPCKMQSTHLLSGIIMMTALWTMNLYIAGTANVPLFSQQSIFKNDFINGLPTGIKPYMTVILILVLTIICKILLDLYMQTKSGYLLRAVGDNHVLVTSLAKTREM